MNTATSEETSTSPYEACLAISDPVNRLAALEALILAINAKVRCG